jgi:hypothetical protein
MVDARKDWRGPEMRKSHLNMLVGSVRLEVAGDELTVADSGDLLQGENLKLALYRALLDALLLQMTLLDQARRLSYAMNSGRVSSVVAKVNAGDSEWKNTQNRG